MKSKMIRVTALIILFLALSASKSLAQGAKLQISHLDHLEAKASQVVTVDIPENLLQIAAKFLNPKKPEEAAAKELVAGLKGVYVKSFQFELDNQYSDEDVRSITSQLDPAHWLKMVDVRSKKEGQVVNVYTILDGTSKINGLAVLATDRRRLTIVNIVGPIDIDKLATLSGKFNIPDLDIERVTGDKKEK